MHIAILTQNINNNGKQVINWPSTLILHTLFSDTKFRRLTQTTKKELPDNEKRTRSGAYLTLHISKRLNSESPSRLWPAHLIGASLSIQTWCRTATIKVKNPITHQPSEIFDSISHTHQVPIQTPPQMHHQHCELCIIEQRSSYSFEKIIFVLLYKKN